MYIKNKSQFITNLSKKNFANDTLIYKDYYKENKNKCDYLGIYNKKTKIFNWAYILPDELNTSNNIIIKQLFDYAYNLKSDNNNELNFFLKKILLNSNIYIKYKEKLEILIAISYYILSNKIKTIIFIETEHLIKYYIVKK